VSILLLLLILLLCADMGTGQPRRPVQTMAAAHGRPLNARGEGRENQKKKSEGKKSNRLKKKVLAGQFEGHRLPLWSEEASGSPALPPAAD